MSRPNKLRQPTQQRVEAAKWLTDFVAQGEQETMKILAQGTALGFSERTIERVKKDIGLYSHKRGNPALWYWSTTPTAERKVVAMPEHALTQQDVQVAAASLVKNWKNIVDPPWPAQRIEQEAGLLFYAAIGSNMSFDAVVQRLTEAVRSYDNPSLMQPFTDEEIRQFAVNGLQAQIANPEMSMGEEASLRDFLRQPQPQPTQFERIAAMTKGQAESMLAMFADVQAGTDDDKLKQVLQARLDQLKNEAEIF
jgi:hypothetical protein